jgi:hypothetical protein
MPIVPTDDPTRETLRALVIEMLAGVRLVDGRITETSNWSPLSAAILKLVVRQRVMTMLDIVTLIATHVTKEPDTTHGSHASRVYHQLMNDPEQVSYMEHEEKPQQQL